jgi:tetratricopeptide (TPR) repeat protein
MNDAHEELLRQADEVVAEAGEQSDVIAAAAIRAVIAKLEGIEDSEHSPRLSYAIGYCWYNIPGVLPERTEKAERWLRKSLLLDQTEQFPRLYLGHLYFDEERFAEARKAFRAIPDGYFSARGQTWRDVKAAELLLCCDIYLDPLSVTEEAIASVLKRYRECGADDAPVPIELARALCAALDAAGGSPSLRDGSNEFIRVVADLGFQKALAEEISAIKARLDNTNPHPGVRQAKPRRR